MRTTPIQTYGKRGRQARVYAAIAERSAERQAVSVKLKDALRDRNHRDDYTPEYWEAKEQAAYTQNNGEFYKGELQDQQDRIAAEAEASRLARQRDSKPGQMSKADWYSLAKELKEEAHEELALATEDQREAAGNRSVNRRVRQAGDSREFVEVGGQTFERKWTGGSATAARKATAAINRETKEQAGHYMTGKLVKYGYKRETITRLSYNQKRRLIAEIGHGQLQEQSIGGIKEAERRQVVESASSKDQLAARSTAINPRAAIGLDTWDKYEIAMIKAGREDQIEAPPPVEERSTPDYVRHAGGRKPERRPAPPRPSIFEPGTIDF